jgi:hypothetical protein
VEVDGLHAVAEQLAQLEADFVPLVLIDLEVLVVDRDLQHGGLLGVDPGGLSAAGSWDRGPWAA